MNQYLVIAPNTNVDDNLVIDAESFDNAISIIRSKIKDGTMFQILKVVELNSLKSKTMYIDLKIE